MIWATDNYSVTDGELWCRRGLATFVTRTALPYLLFNHAGDHVGNLNVFALDWTVPKGELGYWLRTPHAGQGYMTEAVTALARMLFQNQAFNRIEIRTDAANTRSAAVAERCGFTLEGTLHNENRTPGPELRHLRIYAKLPAVSR